MANSMLCCRTFLGSDAQETNPRLNTTNTYRRRSLPHPTRPSKCPAHEFGHPAARHQDLCLQVSYRNIETYCSKQRYHTTPTNGQLMHKSICGLEWYAIFSIYFTMHFSLSVAQMRIYRPLNSRHLPQQGSEMLWNLLLRNIVSGFLASL